MQKTHWNHSWRIVGGVLAFLAASTSCAHTAISAKAPASAAPAQPKASAAPPKHVSIEPREPPSNAALRDVMSDHFMITSWARDAVIAGDVEILRRPLSLLADYTYDDVPTGGWLPWIAQLQAAARLTSNAATVDLAAMGVATMARVCGECHRETKGGPLLPAAPDPVERVAADTVPERMNRHMWAAELLWEGLTGPSDVIWKAGADALISAPAQLDADLPASFDAQLHDVQALGRSASEAATLAERADVYGLLIATCADCHTRWNEHGW